jgi:hypothetical protein
MQIDDLLRAKKIFNRSHTINNGLIDLLAPPMTKNEFSKADYLRTLKSKRRGFLEIHFSTSLNDYFNELKNRANRMLPCSYEMSFEIPDKLNVDRTEEILISYFEDLGYSVIAEPRKDNDRTVVVTVT